MSTTRAWSYTDGCTSCANLVRGCSLRVSNLKTTSIRVYIYFQIQDPDPQTLGIPQEYTLQKWQTPISWRWPEWTYHLTTGTELAQVRLWGFLLHWTCRIQASNLLTGGQAWVLLWFCRRQRSIWPGIEKSKKNVSDRSHWDWRDIWF